MKSALIVYPFFIEDACGARAVLVSYANALKECYHMDLFAPMRGFDGGKKLNCFQNRFRASLPETKWFDAMSQIFSQMDKSPEMVKNPASFSFTAGILSHLKPYDFIGIHYTRYARLLCGIAPPSLKRIVFVHDLDSCVLADEKRLFGQSITGIDPNLTLEKEIECLQDADLVVTLGEDDAKALAQGVPHGRIAAIPPVMPLSKAHPRGRDCALLTISSKAPFHTESLRWALDYVWPSIKKEVPGAIWRFGGAVCDFLRPFAARDPQISLLGHVAEPLIEMGRARVCVAPYLYGGGLKIKIAEALSAGLPVATTSKGMTNISSWLPTHDDAGGFADFCVKMLKDDAAWSAESEKALQIAAAKFSTRNQESLLRAIESIPQRETSPGLSKPLFADSPQRLLRKES